MLLYGPPAVAVPGLTQESGFSESPAAGGIVLEHYLAVELNPEDHGLTATDEIVVQLGHVKSSALSFSLNGRLKVQKVDLVTGVQTLPVPFATSEQPVGDHAGPSQQMITLELPPEALADRRATLRWRYGGVINEPPREPRHLRFVTPSETAGHIGAEGVYLSGETLWYPDISGSLPRFRVEVTLPAGWTAVTHGKELTQSEQADGTTAKRTVEWDVAAATEALTLVANKFEVTGRLWKDSDGRVIEIATYLFPEDQSLAEEYLEAAENYLRVYSDLLGPYPFPKFAVVENFFASGLGMPSFTLLGSGVIKRRYTQPYALGHEIVHSWIGNGVFNRPDRGNWVEGLTTYLANYYWHELNGDHKQAREQRRLMVQGYSVYVTPERDYPVGQFTHKRDERDNAIGYQKAAMIFHHLRREVGDPIFWDALRRFIGAYLGRHADWKDLEDSFAKESGRDLRWFFSQWVEHKGAPDVRIVGTKREQPSGSSGEYRLTVSLKQDTGPYRLSIPLLVRGEQNAADTVLIDIASDEETRTLTVPNKPLKVELDPDVHVFQRIERPALPPMLNLYVTDLRRAVVVREDGAGGPYQEVVARIAAQEKDKPESGRTSIVTGGDPGLLPATGSVLVLAGPDSRAWLRSHLSDCGAPVDLRERGFTVSGTAYEGATMALLVSCHRKHAPGSVLSVLYGVTPEAVKKVARLLFFYGWHSAVVFRDGSVFLREEWTVGDHGREVRIDGTQRSR